MATFTSALKVTIAFLRSAMASSQAEEDNSALRTQQFEHLKALFQKSSTTLEDATEAMQLSSQSADVFSMEQMSKLRQIIGMSASCTGAKPGAAVHRGITVSENQVHKHMENYFTEQLWTTLLRRDISLPMKMAAFVAHFVDVVGLLHPKEVTYCHALSILIAAHGPQHLGDLQAYQWLQDLKTAWQARRKIVKTNQGLAMYPEDVTDFVSMFPATFPEGQPPVPSRLPKMQIAQASMCVHARRTHKQVRAHFACSSMGSEAQGSANLGAFLGTGGSPALATTANQHPFAMLQTVVQNMNQMMQAMQGPPDSAQGIRLQMVGGGGLANQSSARPPPTRNLALMGEQTPPSAVVPAEASVLAKPNDTPWPEKEPPALKDKDEIDTMIERCKEARSNPKPKAKATAKAKTTAKAKAKAKASCNKSSVIKTSTKKPPMPKVGVATEPIIYKGCRVYTSVANQKWRVLPKGARVDKAFSWKHDPKGAWAAVLAECEDQAS